MRVEICGRRETADEPKNGSWSPRHGRATLFTCAFLALLLSCAVGFAAVKKPAPDRPGNTSAKDLESGEVPLSSADLQFYLTIMRASVSRYEHPTAQDLADVAEDKRLKAIEMADSQKMAQDLRAGNTQKAIRVDPFHATPAQDAIMRRGDDLLERHIPSILAGKAGMSRFQWDELSRAIDETINGPAGAGSGDEGPPPKLSAAASARAARIVGARAANRKLVLPSAAEITGLNKRMGKAEIALEGK